METLVPRGFTEPRYRASTSLRWVIAAGVAAIGCLLLRDSYRLSDAAMEWRIVAGVSALAFVLLTILDSFEFTRRLASSPRGWMLVLLLGLVGALCVRLGAGQSSRWAAVLLIESGVELAFIAAVDLLLGTVRTVAVEREQEERAFYDELALDVGYAEDLTLWQYRAMRDGLDTAVAQGLGRTRADRVLLFLDFASKARALPAHLDLPKRADFQEGIAREVRIARLTTLAAKDYRLTDSEYLYLAAVIDARADPFTARVPIGSDVLAMVVENSAEQIRRKRYRGCYVLSVATLEVWKHGNPIPVM